MKLNILLSSHVCQIYGLSRVVTLIVISRFFFLLQGYPDALTQVLLQR